MAEHKPLLDMVGELEGANGLYEHELTSEEAIEIRTIKRPNRPLRQLAMSGSNNA
jgi:hypothetical protein